jgi:type VI secretion system protein ImpM
MSKQSIANGYYGKVSTLGDFVSRGLPISFIDPWDAWLQEAIVSSRQQLGDNWLNCYLTGPIYRFALTPGVCGEHGWLGVVMPSVDSVGRYYPITIATLNKPNINPFILMQQESAWFASIEALALSSLADNFSLERFNKELDEVMPDFLMKEDGSAVPPVLVTKQTSHHAWQGAMKSNQTVKDALPFFVNEFLKEHYFAYSFCWTQGSELVAPSILICEGLPPFDGVAAMLDGNWQKWGWEGCRYPFGEQDETEK